MSYFITLKVIKSINEARYSPSPGKTKKKDFAAKSRNIYIIMDFAAKSKICLIPQKRL